MKRWKKWQMMNKEGCSYKINKKGKRSNGQHDRAFCAKRRYQLNHEFDFGKTC